MPWNYRVIRHYYQSHMETVYAIHAVHYQNGNIVAVSDIAEVPIGESLEELRGELRRMFIDALSKPILDYDNIEFGTWEDDAEDYDCDDELNAQGHLWANNTGYDSH